MATDIFPDYSGCRIMAVDAVMVNIYLLTKILEKTHATIIPALGGQEAIEKTVTEKPDIILLDLRMPVIDGYEVIDRLKSSPDTAAIPIIVISAYTNQDDVDKTKAAGAADFIQKPVIMQHLLESITTQLIKINKIKG